MLTKHHAVAAVAEAQIAEDCPTRAAVCGELPHVPKHLRRAVVVAGFRRAHERSRSGRSETPHDGLVGGSAGSSRCARRTGKSLPPGNTGRITTRRAAALAASSAVRCVQAFSRSTEE